MISVADEIVVSVPWRRSVRMPWTCSRYGSIVLGYGLELLSDQITSSISWNVKLDKLFQAFGGGKSENRSACGFILTSWAPWLKSPYHGIPWEFLYPQQNKHQEMREALDFRHAKQLGQKLTSLSFKTPLQPVKKRPWNFYAVHRVSHKTYAWNLHFFKCVYENLVTRRYLGR